MKGTTIGLAVFAAALAATATHAQPVPQSADVAVTGSVDRLCVLSGPQVDLGASINISQVSGSSITIANLSDEQQMTTKATDFVVRFPGMCNFTHQLTVSSDRGGLWRSPAGARVSGFANGVPYRAVVDWDGSQTTLFATAAAEGEVRQSLTIDRPSTGDVAMHFHIDQNATNAGAGAPLVAGPYNDTIRVTLGPL